MKNTLLFLIFILAVFSVKAQNITGKITDKESRPIELATIILQTTDSAYVTSTYTDSLGIFTIETDPQICILTVRHLMYEPYQETVHAKDIHVIKLQEKDQLISEVTVTGQRPLVRMIDGKMTYDMPQILKNRMAGNAYEAILELPGVYEQDNTVNLAGVNGVTVILNGKATTMTNDQLTTLLKNMPKERIRNAEIMYSAPPQYHVRGAAINLVLTSGTSESPKLQGQLSGSYDQNHYAGYQSGAGFTYTTPNISTDFIYSFNYVKSRNGQDILSHHLYQEKVYDITQYDRGYFKIPIHNIRLGNDWFINDKNKMSLVYTVQIRPWSHSFTRSTGTYSGSQNMKKPEKPVQMHNLALSYTSGSGLDTGVDYTHYYSHTRQNYEEKMENKEDAFTAKAKQNIHKISFHVDQSHSLGKSWKLNYGAKFSYASDKSSQIYHSLKGHDLSASNSNSKLDEYTYDLYAGFEKNFSERLSVTASLTGEYYKHKNIGYWSMFPTVEATYVADPANILQLSVSSDKAYPSYWEMQDAISYLSGYAEIHGNADLKPANSYSAQLNYILKQKYIFGIYTNYVDDHFNQLPYQQPDRLVLIYKTLNVDYMSKTGVNLIVPFRIGEMVDSRLMLNGYYDRVISSTFHDISFDKRNFAVYASLNNTFNISSRPNIKATVSGAYITRNIQGPMTLSRMYKADAGIKWVFYNNNAEISLKINDMFNSWSPKEIVMDYKGQNLKMNLVQDSRRVSLSFTYKFGGYKESTRKEVDTSRFGTQ